MKKISTYSLCLIAFMFIAGCDRDGAKWKKAQEQNTTQSYEEYLSRYPEGKYAEQAKANKEQLAWDAAKKTGTVISYELFIKEYSEGKYAKNARQEIELLIWNQSKEQNSIESYEKYLYKYPEGTFSQQAKDNIEQLTWNITEKADTTESYEIYIEKYPMGKFVETAMQLIEKIEWEQAAELHTIQSYVNFVEKYPNSENIPVAQRRINGIKLANGHVIDSEVGILGTYMDGYQKFINTLNVKHSIISELGTAKVEYTINCKSGMIVANRQYSVLDCGGAQLAVEGSINIASETGENKEINFNGIIIAENKNLLSSFIYSYNTNLGETLKGRFDHLKSNPPININQPIAIFSISPNGTITFVSK